jgi:exopolysaccharide production protein ExoQ
LMLTTRLQFMQRKPAAVHILVLLLVVSASALILFGGRASVASALGRNANLARMDIWEAIIPMAPNALIGAGFESFWLGTRVERLAQLFPNLGLNEAHDGYIEVYLELGWVGLTLIALLWIDAYRRAVKAFRLEPAIGGLLLAYILTAVTYNVTEAGFRMLDPLWIFFLLAVVESSSIVSGVRVGEATRLGSSLGRMPGLAPRNGPALRPDRRDMTRKTVQRRTA